MPPINKTRPIKIGRTISHKHKLLHKGTAVVSLLLSLAIGGMDKASALPVYSDEGNATALRQVPVYRDFTQTLDGDTTAKEAEKGRKIKMMEWVSPVPSKAYLVCLHAFGLSSREYADFGSKMSGMGFDVAALDVRGFGPSRTQPGNKKIDFEGTVSDVRRLLKTIRKQDSHRKIFLVGESMGGAIAIRLASENPELVDGVICSAPAWQVYKIKRITAKGLLDRIFGEPGFAARSVAMQASTSEKLQKQWLEDRTYRTNVSIPEAYSYYRLMKSTPKSAERIGNLPVLVVQGLNDRLSKPVGAAELFNVLGSTHKQLAIVADGEHLVFEEGQLKSELAGYVANWINSAMSKTLSVAEPSVVVLDRGNMPAAGESLLKQMLQLSGIKLAKGIDRGI